MGCGAAVGVLGVPRVPSLEGSGPVGSGGLTSRVCVFTKGTSPSRIVPSYNLLQVGAHAADPAHGLRAAAGGHAHAHTCTCACTTYLLVCLLAYLLTD